MRFEWDEAKNRRNLAKHGISFEIAKSVFEDSHALSIPHRVVEDEEDGKRSEQLVVSLSCWLLIRIGKRQAKRWSE